VRPSHQVLRVAAISDHIQLEPRRDRGGVGDFLDAADGHGGLGERDAHRLGGPRGLHLGAGVVHAGHSDRGQDDREVHVLAQHMGGLIALGHIAQHDLAQPDLGKVRDVGVHGRLVGGTAVDVVEQLSRQPSSGELAVVLGGGRREAERAVFAERHGRLR